MKNDISKNVLDKILCEDIKQKPRYVFLLRKSVLWTVAAVATIVGIIGFSIMLFLLREEDWDVYHHVADSELMGLLSAFPYFWLLIFVIFAVILAYNIKHTEDGYKMRAGAILGVYAAVTIVCGTLLYVVGVAEAAEHALAKRIPIIEQFPGGRARLWIATEKGLLGGHVHAIEDEETFILIDPQKREWMVLLDDDAAIFVKDIRVNMRIKLIGEREDDDEYVFEAKEIRPWFPEKKVREKIKQRRPQKRF